MNHCKAWMKVSVSNDATTSMCMALIDKQEKMTLNRITILRPRFISNGPKQSTPTQVNGGSSGETLLEGKFAICWHPVVP